MLCLTHDVTKRWHRRATRSWAKVMILSESAPQSNRKTAFLSSCLTAILICSTSPSYIKLLQSVKNSARRKGCVNNTRTKSVVPTRKSSTYNYLTCRIISDNRCWSWAKHTALSYGPIRMQVRLLLRPKFLQTNYLSTLFLLNSYTIKIKAVPLQQQNPPRFP